MSDGRVVLAYSGDLVSSVVLAWLREHDTPEVATVTLDLGQGRDLNDVRDRALGIGASRAHVIDVRDVFAREAVAPAWRLPLDEPRTAALARPFIAQQLVELAAIEGINTVAHGSVHPAQNPQGLDALIHAASPNLEVLAPARDWAMDQAALVEFGRARGIPVPSAGEDAIEIRNLWGRYVFSRQALTRTVEHWPSEASVIDITFDQCLPVALNGVTMSLVDVIVSLETMAGAHGVGLLEYPDHGVVEEAPASFVLHHALQALGSGSGTIRATCQRGGVSFSSNRT